MIPRLASILVLLGLLVVAIYAWVRTSYLALPVPVVASILAIVSPIFTYLSIAAPGTTRGAPSTSRALAGPLRPQPVRPIVALILDVVLVTLAATNLDPSLQTCALATQWLGLFERKAATSIRRVQDALQCCGFRSSHDQAWPFPDAHHGARACEETFARAQACLGPWRREENVVLGLMLALGAACAVYKGVLLLIMHFRPAWLGQGALHTGRGVEIEGGERRLIESGIEDQRDEPEPYTDDPQATGPRTEGEGEERILARLQNGDS